MIVRMFFLRAVSDDNRTALGAVTAAVLMCASACTARSDPDVDAKMAPYEAEVSAEAVWLEKNNTAPGGLLQRTTSPELYRHILKPSGGIDPGNTAGRQEVSCAAIASQPRLAVLLIAGQSNAANGAAFDGNGRAFQTTPLIYNLNVGNGKCYAAKDPLLGADGPSQAFARPLAAYLVESGLYHNVLLVPIAISATLIEEWVPSGHHWPRFTIAISQLNQLGLRPTVILWHQGEGNSGWLKNYPKISQSIKDAVRLSYMRNFLNIVNALRGLGVTAPISPAVATQCGSAETSPEIRAAQLAVVDPAWGIFQGPDTDVLDFSYRRPDDLCHFSHEGNQAHARAWLSAIQSYLLPGVPEAAAPDARLGALAHHGIVVLSWSSRNVSSCTMSYVFTDGTPGNSFVVAANTIDAGHTGIEPTKTVTLTCLSPSGQVVSSSVTIVAGQSPTVTLLANGMSRLGIVPGQTYTLSYGSSGVSSCTMNYAQPGGAGFFPVSPNSSGSRSSRLVGSYLMTCRTPGGRNISKVATITD